MRVVFGSFTLTFSGRLGSSEMDSFEDPKWSRLGTENELSWGPEMDSCEDRLGDRKLIHFETGTNSFFELETEL